MSCDHANAQFNDPLDPGIKAALRLPCTDEAAARDVARRIVQAVWCAGTTNPAGKEYTSAHGCAALRQHPDLHRFVSPHCMVFSVLWARHVPEQTEIGLGERIAALHGGDVAWAMSGWLTWDGRRWLSDPDNTAATAAAKHVVRGLLAREVVGARHHLAVVQARGDDDDDTDRAAELSAATKALAVARAFAARSASARAIKAGLELARSEPGIAVPAENWDARPDLIAVGNGTVELREAEAKLREHRREDRLTMITRAEWRPKADRSVWDKFCRDVMPDPDVRGYVQRLAGYSLLGDNRERVFVILIGPSTTGKSTLVETIAHVLGDYGGAFDLSLFRGNGDGGKPRPDLVAALPRRMIQTTEASDRWQLHGDAIKRVTGGDTLLGRGLYARTEVERRPAFVPWLASNAAPQVIGVDQALWRRLIVVPFETVVKREDSGLGRRLREDEADAVLAWMIEGWEMYARDGLGQPPAPCRAAAERLRTDLSLVDHWLAEQTEPDPDAIEPAAVLADSWHDWCVRNRVQERDQLSNVSLGRALSARGFGTGFTGTKDGRQRTRTGLRLLTSTDPGLRAVR